MPQKLRYSALKNHEKTAIEDAKKELADELAKSDSTADSLKAKTDALAEKAMKLGEAVYKASQEASASNGDQKPNDDGTRDADFSEKK